MIDQSRDSPLTAVLRAAVINSPIPLKDLAERTQIDRSALERFRKSKRSISLDAADRLTVFFGLELRPTMAPFLPIHKGFAEFEPAEPPADTPLNAFVDEWNKR